VTPPPRRRTRGRSPSAPMLLIT